MGLIVTPMQIQVAERYKLDGTPEAGSTARILNMREIVDLVEAPAPKGGYSPAEAMDLISQLESEEAGVPMPRAAQLLYRKQLSHNREAILHEKEQAKAAEYYRKKQIREGIKKESVQ